MDNLIDFLPTGSFAIYKTIESVINLPIDSTQCDPVQRGFLMSTLAVCGMFCFITTLYPSQEQNQRTYTRFVGRVASPILLCRACLALVAFMALTLPMSDVMGCVFLHNNDTASRVLPLLLGAICSLLEHVRNNNDQTPPEDSLIVE